MVKFQYQRMHTRTQIIVIILVPSIHELPPNEAPEALRYHLKKDANVNHDEQQLATAASIRSDCSTPLADVGFQGNITMRSHSPVCQDSWFQTSNKVDRFALVVMPILYSLTAVLYWTYYLCRYLSITYSRSFQLIILRKCIGYTSCTKHNITIYRDHHPSKYVSPSGNITEKNLMEIAEDSF